MDLLISSRVVRALQRLAIATFVLAGLTAGCSFVLDTEGLQSGGAGGSGGSSDSCASGSTDRCTNCLVETCCSQYSACMDSDACKHATETFLKCRADTRDAGALQRAKCVTEFTGTSSEAEALGACSLGQCKNPCN